MEENWGEIWDMIFGNKQTSKNCQNNFLAFFPKGKKAMETWQLVMIILALILLVFVLAWYGGLSDKIKDLLGSLGKML